MSDPQHATYSRYIYTRDGRVYGYLFTDSEGSQWGDLLPGRRPISHRHHTGSLHAAAGHHLHHGFAHRHRGHHPHHLQTVAAATDSLAGHRRAIPAPRINPYSGEVIDPNDGMADNLRLQALFHSSAGQTFVEADTFVAYITYIATAEYTIAFFMPEIIEGVFYVSGRTISPLARWGLNQAGAFGPAVGRLFWSQAAVGGAAALAWAEEFGGNTLEMTPIGEYAVQMQSWYGLQTAFSGWAWNWLSAGFAEGIEGPARFFSGAGGYQGAAWSLTELPILVRNAVTIIWTMH